MLFTFPEELQLYEITVTGMESGRGETIFDAFNDKGILIAKDVSSRGGIYPTIKNRTTSLKLAFNSRVGSDASYMYQIEFKYNITLPDKTFILSEGEYKKYNEGNPEIIYPIPSSPLASNIGEDVEVSASAERVSHQNHAWKAFDRTSGFWYTGAAPPSGEKHWYKIDVKEELSLREITLKSATVSGTVKSLKDWDLYGSVDNHTYEKLGSYIQPNDDELNHYTIKNNKKYRYYRLSNLTSYSTDSTVGIDEIYLNFAVGEATPSSWKTVSTTLPSLTQFQEEGMDVLSILDRKVQQVLDSPHQMTDNGVLGEGKVFKGAVDLKKYFDLRKLEVK